MHLKKVHQKIMCQFYSSVILESTLLFMYTQFFIFLKLLYVDMICTYIHEIRLKGTYECVKCSKAENGYKY